MTILYEDNHIIIVNKAPGEIVQGDKTGDRTLADDVKAYIKEKYNKPGEVFLGTVHRLDRPVSGIVVFARTSKALARLNEMFRVGSKIRKTYHAIVCAAPAQPQGELTHWLTRNEKQTKPMPTHVRCLVVKRQCLTIALLLRQTVISYWKSIYTQGVIIKSVVNYQPCTAL